MEWLYQDGRSSLIYGQIADGASGGLLNSPVDQWADELTTLTLEYGMNTYVLMANDLGQIRRFAEEVVPRVRERVGRERRTTK